MPTLEFRIKKNGEVSIEGKNCTGETCSILSKPFEDALGVVTDTQKKPEYYVELDGVEQRVGEGNE